MKDKVKEIVEKTGRFYIGFVGDSLTSCEWVHPNWREIVEYVLKEEMQKEFSDWRIPSWGIRGFNFGYDGATTKDIWEKVDEIIRIKPDIVISLMGGNDAPIGIEPEESKEYIEKILKKLTNAGIGVYWSTSLPALSESKSPPLSEGSVDPSPSLKKEGVRKDKNLEYQPYAEVTKKIRMPGVEILNLFADYQQYDLKRFFTFISEENVVEGIKAGETDLQHPNQLGNAYVAKLFLEKIFGITMDAELYIKEVNKGEKLPKY